jgi:hypothetical protein
MAFACASRAERSRRPTVREEIRRQTAEFLDLYRKHWPEVEVECEVRPIEFLLSDAGNAT